MSAMTPKPTSPRRQRLRALLRKLGIAVLVFALASWGALYSYGRFAERAMGEPSHALPASADGSSLDRLLVPELAGRPGQSGMILIDDNIEAYAIRARSARSAERSLDVMYYIWKADQSGHLLARELVHAADRGVRVRLLLDDISQRGMDHLLLALHAHENLEVRLFNPGRNRSGTLGRGLELLLRASSMNRRMHNKAWIADNRIAIVGGRNVGDEYFDGAERVNFRDADLLLVGPAVEQTSEVFDQFWNSTAAIPISALAGRTKPEVPEYVRSGDDLRRSEGYKALLESAVSSMEKWLANHQVHWSSKVKVVSDPPEKASPHEVHDKAAQPLLIETLGAWMSPVEEQLVIVSPYFVPGREGTRWLSEQSARGRSVHVLTNSLAATDVVLVHSGYAKYRRPLLQAGVHLHELTPDQDRSLSWLGSSNASLHTKAFVVDSRRGFVGSFNFDPRSTWLNTEMGVLFEQADLAQALLDLYQRKRKPGSSFELFLDDGAIRWRDQRGEAETIWTHDPDSHWLLRMTIAAAGWLPIEAQL